MSIAKKYYMNKVELMTVEDAFMIENIGLLIVPLFEVPHSGKWENITEDLTVQSPDKESLVVCGSFQSVHFNIRDQTPPINERWKIQLVLQNVSAESIPAGSVVFCCQKTKNIILGSQ